MAAARSVNLQGRSKAEDPFIQVFWSAAFARKPASRAGKIR